MTKIFLFPHSGTSKAAMIGRMTHSTALYVAIVVAASLAVGWYGSRAWIAHGDLTGTARKISGLRKARGTNGTIAVLVIIIGLFVLYHIVTQHK
jgi:hypothetical protein